MPGGDGTGPMGQGPMTGRAAGLCAGYGVPGYANPMMGHGAGWGRGGGWGRRSGCDRGGYGLGRGRGWRNWFHATGLTGWQRAAKEWPGAAPYGAPAPAPEQELEMLKAQADQLGRAMTDIRKRIEELEAAASEA